MAAVRSLLESKLEHVSSALTARYEASDAHPRGLLPVELSARANNKSVVHLLLERARELGKSEVRFLLVVLLFAAAAAAAVVCCCY